MINVDNDGLFHGAKWALISNWYGRIIGLANTLILLKLLTPEDFGIAALSTFFVSMFVAFSHVGVAHFVISSDDLTDSELDSIWSLGFFTKTVTAICLFLSAEIIADFVKNQSMVDVIQIVSIIPFLSGLRNVALDVAEKKYQFKTVILTTIIARTVGTIVSISLALYLESYWALVIGVVLSMTTETIVGYVLLPRLPRFSCRHWSNQWGFSKWLYMGSIVGYLRSRIDVLLLGNITDIRSVGLYNVSTEFSWLPFNEVIVPINRGFFAVLSRVKANKALFLDKIMQQLSVNMLIVFPCSFGLMAISESFTMVILGEQWLAASALINYLSPLMIVMSLYGIINSILTIKKKMPLLVLSDFIVIIGITSVFFAYKNEGIEVLSALRLVVGVLFLFWLVFVLISFVRVPFFDALVMFTIPFTASLAMYKTVLYVTTFLDSHILILIVSIVVGAMFYIVLFMALSYLSKSFFPYYWRCCTYLLMRVRPQLSMRVD